MSFKKWLALLVAILLLPLNAAGANAKPKSPVTVTFKSSVAVPSGSQDFHFGRNQQGAFIAQWLVETSSHRWQIWQGDYNPYEGVILNQNLTYQLPAGTTFLSKPVMSYTLNSLGIVYSTYWETSTEVKSEVEAILLEADGNNQHQVLSQFPTISILKSSDEYLNGCQSATNRCGYKKVAIGGDYAFQMTVAALEYVGVANARIGISSTVYLRAQYWTTPEWLNSGLRDNFDTEHAFVADGSDGAFFVYVDQQDASRPKYVRVSLDNGQNLTQIITSPVAIGSTSAVSEIKVTKLNGNHSAVTFVTENNRNLQLWRAELSTQFDNVGMPLVAFSAASREQMGSSYQVNRISDNSFEVLIKSVDSRLPEYWQVDKVSTNIFDFDSDSVTLLKGNDSDLSPVFGSSFTSQNSGYALNLGVTKANGSLGATSVYQSDVGFIPVPVKAKGGVVSQQTMMGQDNDSLVWNINLVRVGTTDTLEISKVVAKVAPKLYLFAHTYSAQPVGTPIGYTLSDWTSLSGVQSETRQWVRCTKRITQVGTSLPKGCARLAGQTEFAYTITSADVGKYLTLVLTATNRWGTSQFVLPSTKAVK